MRNFKISRSYNERRKRPNEGGRPNLIFFNQSKNIKIKGITLKNGAEWVTKIELCDSVEIDEIKLESDVYWNNDGIDLDDTLKSWADSGFDDEELDLLAQFHRRKQRDLDKKESIAWEKEKYAQSCKLQPKNNMVQVPRSCLRFVSITDSAQALTSTFEED